MSSTHDQVSENAALVGSWLDLWNGNLALADCIVASDFLVHAAPITGGSDEMRGREALKQWVGGLRGAMNDLRFSIEVGPIATGDYFSVRWRAKGTYIGGFPGAPESAIGREIDITGTDTLRIQGSQLAEYWANSDTLLLIQQLGMFPSAPR